MDYNNAELRIFAAKENMFADQKGYTTSHRNPVVGALLARTTEIGLQAEIANHTALKINIMIAADSEAAQWDFVEYYTPENVNLRPAMDLVVALLNNPQSSFKAEIVEDTQASSDRESCKIKIRIQRI